MATLGVLAWAFLVQRGGKDGGQPQAWARRRRKEVWAADVLERLGLGNSLFRRSSPDGAWNSEGMEWGAKQRTCPPCFR